MGIGRRREGKREREKGDGNGERNNSTCTCIGECETSIRRPSYNINVIHVCAYHIMYM